MCVHTGPSTAGIHSHRSQKHRWVVPHCALPGWLHSNRHLICHNVEKSQFFWFKLSMLTLHSLHSVFWEVWHTFKWLLGHHRQSVAQWKVHDDPAGTLKLLWCHSECLAVCQILFSLIDRGWHYHFYNMSQRWFDICNCIILWDRL